MVLNLISFCLNSLYPKCPPSLFGVSINCEALVVFLMPTQEIHSYHIRSAGLTSPLACKLTKTQQLPSTSTHQLRILTNSSTQKIYQLINLPTHHLTNSSSHKLIISQTHKLTNSENSQTQKLRKLTNSSSHKLTNSQTPQLTKLKLLVLFYNAALIFAPF